MNETLEEVLDHIDLNDPDVKSQIASLVPYLMKSDAPGIERGLNRLDPDLQVVIVRILRFAYDFVGVVLGRLEPGINKAGE